MKRITQMIKRSKRESTKAIKQFLTTEELLKKENEEIDKALNLIDEETDKLLELKTQGETLYRENEGISGRIAEFVRGSSEKGENE